MENNRYNGWTNYETWNAKLWIDNDEGSQNYWIETAQQTWEASEASKHLTRREVAQSELAETLKDYFQESMPDLGSTMWADLLNASFSEIDWHEIAESIFTDNGWRAEMESASA